MLLAIGVKSWLYDSWPLSVEHHGEILEAEVGSLCVSWIHAFRRVEWHVCSDGGGRGEKVAAASRKGILLSGREALGLDRPPLHPVFEVHPGLIKVRGAKFGQHVHLELRPLCCLVISSQLLAYSRQMGEL